MKKWCYYNENNPEAALWIRSAIKAGILTDGEIDERSIEDVRPDDVADFFRAHWFSGIGGWEIAIKIAESHGWQQQGTLWTGSCPCQPFSTAGKGLGVDDPRHLWPAWFWLIQQCKPSVVFGEQVAAAVTKGWWDDVATDMENEGYACGAAIIPACSVGAPHKRDRLWFVANTSDKRPIWGHNSNARCSVADSEQYKESENRSADANQANRFCSSGGALGDSKYNGQPAATLAGGERASIQHDAKGANCASESERAGIAEHVANASAPRLEGYGGHEREYGAERRQEQDGHFRAADFRWVNCPDGKARPVKSGLCLLADGIPAKLRKAALHGFGNAIEPEVAAEFITAYNSLD